MNNNQLAKREVIESIKETIKGCKSFAVVDYKGVTVLGDTALRVDMRKAGIEYKVLKNTLVRIALNEMGYNDFDVSLNGPSAIAFSHEDALAPFKVLDENIKKLNKMTVKCGMLDAKFIDSTTCKALANVPARPQLLSMLCNVLQAPIRGLAVALQAVADKEQA